ncbi:hypothetical protein D3C83_41780 [compost metagenome]
MQLLDKNCRWRHHLRTEHAEAIGDHRRRAAGTRENRDAPPRRRFVRHHQLRQFEQTFEHVHAQDAVRAKESTGEFVRSYHRAGM